LSPAPETRHHVSPVDFITVRARGKVGGFVRFREDDHPVLPPRRAVLATVARKLGGRAAEIVQLGEADGGSGGPEGSDLAIATRMLAEVAARHGLGRDGSLIWYPHRDSNKPMPAAIAAAVEADLKDQQARAEAIIAANADLVVELARRLIADRTIDAETFARDFAGRVTWEAGG
jgi:ATP-dependent Zn protease